MKLKALYSAALGIVYATSVHAEPQAITPAILNAYVAQVGAMCHRSEKGDALLTAVAQRADLNGDGIDDWVIDVGKACPTSTGPTREYGSQVTVFRGTKEGDAFPAFQQAAFASRLERVAGKTRLVLTLGGGSCGLPTAGARCDRVVVWTARTSRFDLAPLAPTGKTVVAPN